jgi:murein L,D-transpeptidase YcbB/YkuD
MGVAVGNGWRVSVPAVRTRTGATYESPQTKAVVQAVQRRHGIKADGVYGPVTMRAMYWRMVRHAPPFISSQKCYSPF